MNNLVLQKMLLIISIVKNGLDQTIYIPEMCMKDFQENLQFSMTISKKRKKNHDFMFFSKNPNLEKNKYKEILVFH